MFGPGIERPTTNRRSDRQAVEGQSARHAEHPFRSHADVFQTSSVDGGGPQSNLDRIVATVGMMPWQLPVAFLRCR